MAQRELFENPQFDLADNQEPNPDAIRQRLNAALEELNAAKTFPWTRQQLRSWQHVFRNMSNWLPENERNEIQAKFLTELNRWQRHQKTIVDDARISS